MVALTWVSWTGHRNFFSSVTRKSSELGGMKRLITSRNIRGWCLGRTVCVRWEAQRAQGFWQNRTLAGNRGVNACKIVFDSESGSGVESRANAERSGVEGSTSR
jgi:hypothetical protein